MNERALLRVLRGPFTFLLRDAEEIRSILGSRSRRVPLPQRIFLEAEGATPVLGFPILQSADASDLRDAVEAYVVAEEGLEVTLASRRPLDRREVDAAWERYRRLLAAATENAVSSSFGRRFASIFWLYHSIAVSRVFKQTPQRLRRRDLELGRDRGDAIKYRIFGRFLDRALSVTHEVIARAAAETEEEENDLFPETLEVMRDNVLLLTEDHVSRDLSELASYFAGHVRIDAREFRDKLAALDEWQRSELAIDRELRCAVRHLLAVEDLDDSWKLMVKPGYVRLLSTRSGYDTRRFFDDQELELWEGLLGRLKEFELLAALRRFVVPVRHESDDRFVCTATSIGRSFSGPKEIALSGTTRPLDFMTPWVVDPLVRRYSLVYDITDFSSIINLMRRQGAELQESSFRKIFLFQRRINRLAGEQRLRLEKYLGDGAFYSGRFPERVLSTALSVQRYYRRALEEGFAFDRGMRIAVNYGRYRLLPIEGGSGGGYRYEFFGHGIVELSRLTTGKTMHEIDEVRTLLVSRGYDPRSVDRFFAPAIQQNIRLLDEEAEKRTFFAYINPNGALVNEGIVATESFLEQLERMSPPEKLWTALEGQRRYVAFELEVDGEPTLVGVRKLGKASLKGLGQLAVFEVVDGASWRISELEARRSKSLVEALAGDFNVMALGAGVDSPA